MKNALTDLCSSCKLKKSRIIKEYKQKVQENTWNLANEHG